MNTKQEKLTLKEKALEDKLEIQIGKLEELSKLSAEEAKAELMDSLKEKARSDAMGISSSRLKKPNSLLNKKLRKLLLIPFNVLERRKP